MSRISIFDREYEEKQTFGEKLKNVFTNKKEEKQPEPTINDSEVKEMQEKSEELFERVLANQIDKSEDKEIKELWASAENKIVKDLYDKELKEFQSSFAEDNKGSDNNDLIKKYYLELNRTAKDLGVIDKYDSSVAKMLLEANTYSHDFEKRSLSESLKIAARNQYEGIQFAGIAGQALFSGDKSIYIDKAGMDKDSTWWDVASDLLFSGNKSETGGKMLAVDLMFLIPGIGTAAGLITRTATKGIGKVALKQVTKEGIESITKGTVKSLTKESLETALKSGAKIELRGIGAKATEKQILDLAKKAAREELRQAGKKTATIPAELLEKHRTKIIMDGMSANVQLTSGLKTVSKMALDVINVPYAFSTGQIVKGMIGYGVPVATGLSEGAANVSEYIYSPGNKFAQLYARNNITKFEKQIAEEFTTQTGIDPFSTPEISDEWQAYKNFRTRNESLSTILTGEKEGAARFGGFFLDTIVNLAGMTAATGVIKTGASGASKLVSSNYSLGTSADFVKKVEEIAKEKGLMDKGTKDIEGFVKAVNDLEIKSGGVIDDIKMLNRVEDLVFGIVNKTEPLLKNNPAIASKFDEIEVILKRKDTDKVNISQNYKELKLKINEVVGELKNQSDSYSVIRQTTELKKIAEYFDELELKDTVSSRAKLAVIRNFARGSSAEVRGFLGGATAAEVFAGRNPGLARYMANEAITKTEVAKQIVEGRILEVQRIGALADVVKIAETGMKQGALLPKIANEVQAIVQDSFGPQELKTVKDTVDSSVQRSIQESGIKVNDEITKAIVTEGTLRVLDIYNLIGKTDVDFADLTKDVLSKSFGMDVLGALAGESSKVADFLENSPKDVLSRLEKAMDNNNNIFNKDSETYKEFSKKYKEYSSENKTKLRELSNTQLILNEKLNTELMQARMIKNKLEQIEALGGEVPKFVDGAFVFKGRTIKNTNTLAKAMDKEVKNLSDKLPKDFELTKEEIKSATNENFKFLLDENQKLVEELKGEIGFLKDSFLRVHQEHQKNTDVETSFAKAIEEIENDFERSSVDVLINTFLDSINAIKPPTSSIDKLLVKNDIQGITKISKTLTVERLSYSLDEKLTPLNRMEKDSVKRLREIKEEIGKATNEKEVAKGESEFLGILIGEIEKEIDTLGVDSTQRQILEIKRDNFLKLSNGIKLDSVLDIDSRSALESMQDKAAKAFEGYDNLLKPLEDLDNAKASQIEQAKIEDQKASDIKKLEDERSLVRGEIESILEQKNKIREALIEDPFNKQKLVSLAKDALSPDDFYAKLNKKWTDNFKTDIPKEFIDPKNGNYYAIYNALKQTKYSDKFLNFTVKEKNGKFVMEMEEVKEPTLSDGTKLRTDKVQSEMERIADEKGFEIIDVGNVMTRGEDSSFGSLIINKLDDNTFLDKFSGDPFKGKKPTLQEQFLYATAKNMGGKNQIAWVSNKIEQINLMASNIAKIGDKEFEITMKTIRKEFEASQLTIDDPAKVDQRVANFVYSEIIKPLSATMEAKGYTLIGSKDEAGKGLIFVRRKDGDMSGQETFKTFYNEVMGIKEYNDKATKRFKNMASNEIHVDKESAKQFFEAQDGWAPRVDKDGNVAYRVKIIKETANKIELGEGADKASYTASDGQLYSSPGTARFIANQTGNDPKTGVLKGSAFIAGKKTFVNKGLTVNLDKYEYASADVFSSLRNEFPTIGDFQKQYDFAFTETTMKALGLEKFLDGEEMTIPVNAFRFKKLSNKVKSNVTAAFQLNTSIPRRIASNPKWTKIYDKGMNDFLKVVDNKVSEYADLINAIDKAPQDAVALIAKSPIGKEIMGDPSMSKLLANIKQRGEYTQESKGLINNVLTKIFKDNIVRTKLNGSESYLLAVNDPKRINKSVTSLNNKESNPSGTSYKGLTEDNYVILERKNYKDRVIKTEEGLEVMTYRYPVNNPRNIRFNKVVWAEDILVDNRRVIRELGENSILNPTDVFIYKQGDMDGDKINIVYDKAVEGNYRKMIKAIDGIQEFKITIDPNKIKNVDPNDMVRSGFDELLHGKLSYEENKILEDKMKLMKKLTDIKSKYVKWTPNSILEKIIENKQLVEEAQWKNPDSGNSFMEKFYKLKSWNKLRKLENNLEAEREATSYATSKIKDAITSNVEDQYVIKRFDELNKEYSEKMYVMSAEIDKIEKNYDRTYLDVSNKTTNDQLSNAILVEKNIPFLKGSMNKFVKKIDIEINKFKPRTPKREKLIKFKNQKLEIFNNKITVLSQESQRLNKQRIGIIKDYELKAKASIAPYIQDVDVKTPEGQKLKEDLQRRIISKRWGGDIEIDKALDYNPVDRRAFFLVDDSIVKEYGDRFKARMAVENLAKKYGISFSSKDFSKIDEISKEIDPVKRDRKMSTYINKKVGQAMVSDRQVDRAYFSNLGVLGKVIEESIFKPLENMGRNVKSSMFSISDIYAIKTEFNSLLSTNNGHEIIKGGNRDALKKQAFDLNDQLFRNKSKPAEFKAPIKAELNKTLGLLTAHDYIFSVNEVKNQQIITDNKLKKSAIEGEGEKTLKEAEKMAKETEYKLNEVDKTKKKITSNQEVLEAVKELTDKISELTKIEKLKIQRTGDPAQREKLLQGLQKKYEEEVNNVLTRIYSETTKGFLKDKSLQVLKKYDFEKDFNQKTIEANKQIAKLRDLAPQDFLSKLFGSLSQSYKNTSVGMAVGRALIESANMGILWTERGLKALYKGEYSDKYFDKYKTDNGKTVKNFKLPEPGKYESSILNDYSKTSITGMDKVTGIKIIDLYNRVTTDIAGKISGKLVNAGPKKMAQDYYRMAFNKKLDEAVSVGKKKYMLKDPSTLSWQQRNEYNKTMNYLKSQARKETEKVFFNYDMNPLIAHKLENALPFTNFLFSGTRLVMNHPRSVLGMVSIFDNIVKNYGDQVTYVMDDENGDPIRVDYGKRLKLGFLGAYAGFSPKLDRLLQFSPGDAGIGMAPVFSYLTGDADWRVKSYLDGEMSGLELSLGAISPSISSLAVGIMENDRAKIWNGASYLMTGWATKSTVNQEIAEDYFIKQDYTKLRNAPDSVRDRLKKVTKGAVDDAALDALIEAQKIGLLSEPQEWGKFSGRPRDAAFADAVKIKAQMLAFGTDGEKGLTEEEIKAEGKQINQFMKHVVGAKFFDNIGDEDWLSKVKQFGDDGHIEAIEKAIPAYGETMRHYYDNIDYYSKKSEAKNMLYGEGSSDEDQLKAQAMLMALDYELVGDFSTFDGKVKALLEGEVSFLFNEGDDAPMMTKERMSEIEFKGFYVSSYEDAIAKNVLHKDLSTLYLKMYWDADQKKDKATKSYAWKNYQKEKDNSIKAFKDLKENHTLDAEIFALKNKKLLKAKDNNGNVVYMTEPIQGYAAQRRTDLNQWYNQIATDRVKFLDSTDLKWSQMTNKEKSLFMALNNGMTVNQAKESLNIEKAYWASMFDSEIPKQTNDTIKLIKSLYE